MDYGIHDIESLWSAIRNMISKTTKKKNSQGTTIYEKPLVSPGMRKCSTTQEASEENLVKRYSKRRKIL